MLKPPGAQTVENRQTEPTESKESNLGPHWWKVSALTTAPSQLPCLPTVYQQFTKCYDIILISNLQV